MTAEKPTIPKVFMLGPIKPATDSVRSGTLTYRDLDPAVSKHKPYEYARMDEFWDAEPDSLEEQEKASQLATQYILMGSQALINAGTEDNRALWSRRYTNATVELYGTPDTDMARKLFMDYEAGKEINQPFYEAAKQVGEYLNNKYSDVYAALDLDNASDSVNMISVADRFEAAVSVLKASYDETWGEWGVERNEESDTLSVFAIDKVIIIGMQRASISPTQLKGLFSHEVLVHGLRSVNGSKRSQELATGLPGYLDAEEGLGVFVEYAVTGKISDKIVDRYTDVAYALGVIDGKEHTRQELIEYAMIRAVKRNDASSIPKSSEDIEKEVYAHVNRIYRGSLGNKHIGIFTKDIAYYNGFLSMGNYISSELDKNKSPASIMEYLLQGKFDPMNEQHVATLKRKV